MNDYTIESVAKALVILKLFDKIDPNEGCEFSLTEITDIVRYSKSTVLRLLYTLQKEKFLNYDSITRKYSLDIQLIRLGTVAKNSLNILKVAKPYIKELCFNTGLVVYFGLTYEEQVIVIDKIYPNKENMSFPSMSAQIGLPMPIYATGIGRLFLGEKTEEEMRNILSRTEIVPITQHTVTDVEKIIELAKKAHDDGFAYNVSENEEYISSICYPIRDYTGKMVAGISVAGIADQVEGELKQTFKRHISNAAKKISMELGYKE